MVLNIEQIKEIVIQRFPLLMIDRVIKLEKNKKIIAIKNISANEIFFLGHFPDIAIMPAALIIESMGQAAGILMAYSNDIKDFKKDPMFLGAINKARFFKSIVPGDQMMIEVEVVKLISNAGIVKAFAKVDGEIVASAELVFSSAKTLKKDSGNIS